MWELDHKESWAPKNLCFWTVVLEKTLESPLNSMEFKPVNPKGNLSWRHIGRSDAKAEAPKLRPPNAKSQLIGKDPDAGKDWRQEEKGMTEDELIGCYHRFNVHEFEQTQGNSEGQGSWCAAVHGVSKSQTWLSSQTTTFFPLLFSLSLLLSLSLSLSLYIYILLYISLVCIYIYTHTHIHIYTYTHISFFCLSHLKISCWHHYFIQK